MQPTDLFHQITKPTLLIDRTRATRNIARMVEKANANRVILRPHFKTHQSAVIGEWFREFGIEKITVSSLDMAAYFADHGWKDINVAFPVNIRQAQIIIDLAKRLILNLVFEAPSTVAYLDRHLESPVLAWIKVDAGYHRTGIRWDQPAAILEMARQITGSHYIRLAGILTHAGDTYHARSEQEVIDLYNQNVQRMRSVRIAMQAEGYESAISVGDTPGCSLVPDLGDVDEIRPGNFVFYDMAQLSIGSCRQEDIAVAMACPVVASHPDRRQLVIHGGAIHFSKEFLMDGASRRHYGCLVPLEPPGWGSIIKDARLVSVSQEHGVIELGTALESEVQVGDLVGILPIHSCLTANLMGRYLTLDGQVVDMARF